MQMKVTKQKDVLKIELPLEKPRPSMSGKTLVVASSYGVKVTDVIREGRHVAVVASAFIYPKRRQRNVTKEEEYLD